MDLSHLLRQWNLEYSQVDLSDLLDQVSQDLRVQNPQVCRQDRR
jgi:hypothetical protein